MADFSSFTSTNAPHIKCPDCGFIKIGKARSISRRIRALQTTHPVRLEFLAVLSPEPADERLFQYRFAEFRRNGEWYKPGRPLLDVIREAQAR